MNSSNFKSTNDIRVKFTRAMSEMYQLEVPLYKKLMSLADEVNNQVVENSPALTEKEIHLLGLEHHGAIRVGDASELSMVRRLFAAMGMHPVDYYDLSVAGIPVHSTAFRAPNSDDLEASPFRVFCSLLRLDLIDDIQLREQASKILNERQIFPDELLKLIELSEKQGGMTEQEAAVFVDSALEVFRWHQHSTVDSDTYDKLKATHGLVADIVSFKGPHINHLTPKVLNIDECQDSFTKKNIKAKAIVEGPPRRDCPILLRQTSFIAIAEEITFSDGKAGTHTARFGEVEQRGMALTPKGRELYDRLLSQARDSNQDTDYSTRLKNEFKAFPDSYNEIHQQGLGYFYYSAVTPVNSTEQVKTDQSVDVNALIKAGIIKISPMTYQDFLPVSAAGIFSSNLSIDSAQSSEESTPAPLLEKNSNQKSFEEALGVSVLDSFSLYETAQTTSLKHTLKKLGYEA